jgi:fructokinase
MSKAGHGAPGPRYLVFGEALTDLVRTGADTWRSVSGGSCWNVARAASTLGLPSAWCGAVSDDLFGRDIVARSRAAGLDTRYIQVVARPPLLAVVHETRPPQYFFVGEADLAFDENRLPEGWRGRCETAHFGCISLVREPLGTRLVRLAAELKAGGTLISFDPNYRQLMGPDYPALFERMAALADIVKISDEDLAQIYPGLAHDAALARVRGLTPDAWLLYTRGSAGLSLYRGDSRCDQPGFRIELRDSVGAGDACLGGFVASLLSEPRAPAAAHARFAAATAAAACTQLGPHAPSREEVVRLLEGGSDRP